MFALKIACKLPNWHIERKNLLSDLIGNYVLCELHSMHQYTLHNIESYAMSLNKQKLFIKLQFDVLYESANMRWANTNNCVINAIKQKITMAQKFANHTQAWFQFSFWATHFHVKVY